MAEIITDVPEAEYHAIDAMSASRLKVLDGGAPIHLTHTLSEDKDTESLRVGSAFHCLALQPERFDGLFVVAPDVDGRTKEGKAAIAAMRETANGRVVLKAAEHERARRMADAVLADPDAKAIFAACPDRELTVIGEVTEDPALPMIRTKMRLDLRGRGLTADLKSMSGLASPRACEKYALDWGVWLQMALYRRLMSVADGAFIVFVESQAPYAVSVMAMAKVDIEAYDCHLDRCIAKYRKWMADPMAGWGRGDLRLPEWKVQQLMTEEA